MQEVARVGIEQRLRLGREVSGGLGTAPGGKIHTAFRSEVVQIGGSERNNR